MVKSGQKAASLLPCLVLFAIAVFFRATGADYGFFNGDERVNDSARFLAGQLVPTQHFYPPFFNYLNGFAFAGLFVFGLLTDMWESTGAFRQVYFDDPTPFYVTARYVTAVIGALSAPLFFSCARRAGLPAGSAFAVGAFATVFPLAVFMAHIAKGDTGLAVGCLAVVWAFLMRIDAARPRRWDIVLGIAVAVAFGFKQSALLLLGPAAIAMIVVLSRREGVGAAVISFLIALIVFLVLWPILNIGILLDLEGFLTFQRIQAVMSVREDAIGEGLPITLGIFGDTVNGLNPILLAIALVTPVWIAGRSCRLERKDALLGLWIANLVSTIVISLLVGTRQPEHLFLPNLYLFLMLAAIALMDMIRVYAALPKLLVGAVALAGFALMAAGTANVVRQALAPPVATDLVAFLERNFPEARVQTGLALPVPTTMAAQRMELDRLDRLGAKYAIDMPEMAEERILGRDAENAIFWVNTPFVMSGLETDEAQEADFPVQPHAWPIQPEEWRLDTWLEQEFDVFVVNDLEYLLNESRSSAIRGFHSELVTRCALAREYRARKPLFLEFDVTVFDCSAA